MAAAHAGYVARLARAPLSTETRRTYASKVRTYLAWLDTGDVDGDPLTDPAVRDWQPGTTTPIWPRCSSAATPPSNKALAAA